VSARPLAAFALRAMLAADVPSVAAIEASSFRAPWSEAAFRHELDIPFSRSFVAHRRADPHAVVGFVVLWLVADEVHLLDLAVDADVRRAGVGRLLAERVLEVAHTAGARLVTLEVAEHNEAARRLYERLGFVTALVRRDYYGAGSHALVMEHALAAA
jgi:ribosomal-protein-alanine N-acetyltransferase